MWACLSYQHRMFHAAAPTSSAASSSCCRSRSLFFLPNDPFGLPRPLFTGSSPAAGGSSVICTFLMRGFLPPWLGASGGLGIFFSLGLRGIFFSWGRATLESSASFLTFSVVFFTGLTGLSGGGGGGGAGASSGTAGRGPGISSG